MNDYINRVLKWIDYNRYTVIAAVLAIILSVYVIGCEAAGSFRGEKVTVDQLDQLVNAEKVKLDADHDDWVAQGQRIQRGYESLASDTTAAVDQIEANQALIDKAVTDAGSLITGAATGNPASAAQLVGLGLGWLGLLGAGANRDKRRTDKVLAKVKQANGGTLPTDPGPVR